MIKEYFGKIIRYFEKFTNYVAKINRGGAFKVRCLIELVIDYWLFGSTITDFFELTFWNKNLVEKAKYVTRRIHKRFIYEVDDKTLISDYCNKYKMYNSLRQYIGRDQIFPKYVDFEKFKFFCEKYNTVFYKPCGNCCGKGIEKIDIRPDKIKGLYEKMKSEDVVLDCPIKQHYQMSSLNSSCVNTVRLFTFRNSGFIYFIGGALRIGTTSFIDNYSAGGIICSINLNTGKTIDRAENKYGQRFENHPISSIKLVNFQIPFWDNVMDYVFEMAQSFELNYVAWDIAIEENGPTLVEANPAGMINVIQIAGATPKKTIILNLEKLWKKKTDNEEKGSYKKIVC